MLTVKLKNIGHIKKGEISIAPLTILVGKNNSGKSYAASSIWAALNFRSDRLHIAQNLKMPEWFEAAIEQILNNQVVTISIDYDMLKSVYKYAEDCIDVSRLFSFKMNNDAKIGFRLDKSEDEVIVVIKANPVTEESENLFASTFKRYLVSIDINNIHGYKRTILVRNNDGNIIYSNDLINSIWVNLVSVLIFKQESNVIASAKYLPAGRSGLMLGYRQLVSNMFRDIDINNQQSFFTRPLRSFLSDLSAPKFVYNLEEETIASWIQKKILHGSINIDDDENVAGFGFVPDETDTILPMHMTSSMVAEVMPIVLTVSSMGGGTIILEEPEAHLHLEAQRNMAIAIARLIRANFNIVITTHSDTFIQQINNLIRLNYSKNNEKLFRELGYSVEDTIEAKSVKAYEFTSEEGEIRIKNLKVSNRGFVVPSLNDVLSSLLDETIEIENAG